MTIEKLAQRLRRIGTELQQSEDVDTRKTGREFVARADALLTGKLPLARADAIANCGALLVRLRRLTRKYGENVQPV